MTALYRGILLAECVSCVQATKNGFHWFLNMLNRYSNRLAFRAIHTCKSSFRTVKNKIKLR